MNAVASEVSARLASPGAAKFSRQNLANILWAYASLEVCFPLPLLLACFCSSSIAYSILGVYSCTCCHFLFPFHQRRPGKCWASVSHIQHSCRPHDARCLKKPHNITERACAFQMCVRRSMTTTCI